MITPQAFLMLFFADHTAGDFCPRVAGGLGVKIVGPAVDDHGPTNDIPHGKTVCPHRQKGPALAQQQGRQVPGMLRVERLGGVIMALGMGEVFAPTIPALMDMQGKEARLISQWQPRDVDHHQNTSPFLEKLNLAGQIRRVRTTP